MKKAQKTNNMYSLKTAAKLSLQRVLLGLLVFAFVSVTECQDCFRFYMIDTFEVWRIPQGSGLCNLNATANCPNNAVGLISNSTTSQFQFFSCSFSPDLTNPSDMADSYSTGSDLTILVNFFRNRGPSLDPLTFNRVDNSSSANLYNVTVDINDTGFARSKSTINILKSDLVTENKSTKGVFNVIMMILFVAVSVVFVARPCLQ